MDLSGLQYPPPTDHAAFERLTRRIFAKRFSCPQMNGRNGQEQQGVDIYAHTSEGFVAIQCKLKDALANEPALRLSEFRRDANAARHGFKPDLRRFILATTAPNDVQLQECARELTAEFLPDGIEVQVFGWDEMRTAIGEDVELREDYLGQSGYAALAEKADQHTALLEQIMSRIPQASEAASPTLKRALDRVKARLAAGQIRRALEDLEALREDEWETATTENRFIILTQTGNAKWQLGDGRDYSAS